MTQEKQSRLTDNGDGTWTLALNWPVTQTLRRDGQEVEEEVTKLVFRRIKGGDLRAIANIQKQGDQFATMFVRLASITMPLFDKLDAEDLAEVEDLMDRFLPQHLKTGQDT